MKTLKHFLQEAFYDFVKMNFPEPFEVYKNITSSELNDLQKKSRHHHIIMLVSPDFKTNYAWNSAKALHSDMLRKLEISQPLQWYTIEVVFVSPELIRLYVTTDGREYSVRNAAKQIKNLPWLKGLGQIETK